MYGSKIVASSNNIPTAYDETAGSLAFVAPSAGNLEVFQTSTTAIVLTVTSGFSAEATANSVLKKHLYIPAASTGSTAGWVKDRLPIRLGDRIYVRSDGSAISSGTVYFNIW